MALYLAYVRPFQEHLRVDLQGLGWSDYIWADQHGQPWETDRLTDVIGEETTRHLGERLTTLDYRHTAVSLGRVFVGESFAAGYQEEVGEIKEPEVDLANPLELSSGRGEKTGTQRYGVWSDIVKHLSIWTVETFRPLSKQWHRFLGLESKGPGRSPHAGRPLGNRSLKRREMDSVGVVPAK
jgi:hypothetical protein